jgi:hypothetical protein
MAAPGPGAIRGGAYSDQHRAQQVFCRETFGVAESNPFFEKYRDRRWQEKRLRIMERAGFRCEMCGSDDKKTQLHIHHGYYRRGADPWDYPDDTLWCLCEACHEVAGELKHDCQLELARINPAFLVQAFSMIRSYRAGEFLIDDEGSVDKVSRSKFTGSDSWVHAALCETFGPSAVQRMLAAGEEVEEGACRNS